MYMDRSTLPLSPMLPHVGPAHFLKPYSWSHFLAIFRSRVPPHVSPNARLSLLSNYIPEICRLATHTPGCLVAFPLPAVAFTPFPRNANPAGRVSPPTSRPRPSRVSSIARRSDQLEREREPGWPRVGGNQACDSFRSFTPTFYHSILLSIIHSHFPSFTPTVQSIIHTFYHSFVQFYHSAKHSFPSALSGFHFTQSCLSVSLSHSFPACASRQLVTNTFTGQSTNPRNAKARGQAQTDSRRES
jgi:hypothetical protein